MASDDIRRIVILGAGQAGGRAAEAARASGFVGEIVLAGEEPFPPYERPPLSKKILSGELPPEATFLRPLAGWAKARIDLRLNARAVAIDRAAKRVRFADAAALDYDRLIIATGARPRPLPVASDVGTKLHYLRTMEDCLRLRSVVRPGARIAILGGGFVGLEVAAAARARGATVSLFEMSRQLMPRAALPEIAAFFHTAHRQRGIAVALATTITSPVLRNDRIEITPPNGAPQTVDALLVGIGAIPNAELAAAAGLHVDDGLIVDEFGRTSDPCIFGAGDVTRHFNPRLGRHIRLESWENAQNQAIAVGRNAAGGKTPHSDIPWFWSDQHDNNFQCAGLPLAWDEIVWRGSIESGRCIAFQIAGGVPVGFQAINGGRDTRAARKLVSNAQPVSLADLANPAIALEALARTNRPSPC